MRTRGRTQRPKETARSQGCDQSNTNTNTITNTNVSQPKEVNEETSADPEDLGNFDDTHVELGVIHVQEVCSMALMTSTHEPFCTPMLTGGWGI